MGRSDSTLKTESYTLKHNNQSFVLLDVPGIEGDEKKLNSKFLTLQEKPMLFFMLQKHPLLRKKEKREKRERLKRSKSQLDSQTEVYTLFNKPINNPRALKDELIDENEKESVRDLNEKDESHFRQTLRETPNSQHPSGFLWPFIGTTARD
ncbi:hypothetical protein Kyoto89A_08140 [Helicobacter pylori]